MKMRKAYRIAKAAKVGDTCICPSCGTKFVKSNYQQAFCKSKDGTVCKDKYWNTVTPCKRNNRTRISPASAAWMARQEQKREQRREAIARSYPLDSYAPGHGQNWNPDDHMHPLDPYALGED